MDILSLWPDSATKMTSKFLLGMFLLRLPKQMQAQLANYNATSPGDLAATGDAIWAQYLRWQVSSGCCRLDNGCRCHRDDNRGHSLLPHHPNTQGGGTGGLSKAQEDVGKGSNGSRHQTPGKGH